MSKLTDEVVIVFLSTPYLVAALLVVWLYGLKKRIKRLERRNDLQDMQWRRR